MILICYLALDALASLTLTPETPDIFTTPPQLDGDLVTLTLLPRTRWQTLLNLEVITQRNKPKEPPKPPEKAPFFLPSVAGVEHRFDFGKKDENDDGKDGKKTTRRLDKIMAAQESIFQRTLEEEDEDGVVRLLTHHVLPISY